jgi:glycerophosphoryl diester phosphodiesterase
MPTFEYLDHPGPIPFAHRGGASEAPENTLPAFQRAVDLGYRYLETDVHATRDGVLLAFHDRVLDRVTDHTGAIAELTYAEIAEARIHGLDPIPRLSELLAEFPDVRFNVDVKSPRAVTLMAATIAEYAA